MNVYRKLFTAAALLVAGFGLARLSGEPAARLSATQSARAVVPSPPATATLKPLNAPFIGAPTDGSPRLVPDFSASNSSGVTSASPAGDVAPQLMPDKAQPDATFAPKVDLVESEASSQANHAPRAKLRNESPRPLSIERRESVLIETITPTAMTNSAPTIDAAPRSASTNWAAAGLVPSGFSQDVASPPAITASYSEANNEWRAEPSISPPPWPSPAEADAPRTHIIVDGDSLERLAGRYLHDPQRSGEIYELNRDLLASPDLLPIGAELVMPARTGPSAHNCQSPHSFLPWQPAVRAATHSAAVPGRPTPSTFVVAPRAQLARPLPVD